MKQLLIIAIGLIALNLSSSNSYASNIISIDLDEVIICPAQSDNTSIPTFNDPRCIATQATNINPQNTAIWVKTTLSIPKEMHQDRGPLSIFISGKTSSQLYFNGQYLGKNGTPSLFANKEFPGKIDAMFYLKPNLIRKDSNELVLFLSAHHGFINLHTPINFIGLGTYAEPMHFIQRNIWQAFIPLGALILGVLYFSVSSFSSHQRRITLLFLLMSIIASSQLLLELSRSLFSYSYPFHDVRLILITILSMSFGICLLIHVTQKFSKEPRKKWVLSGSVVTLIGVILLPGFDPKTAIAILIPSLFSTIIIIIEIIKNKTKELWIYLLFFAFLTAMVLFNLSSFHTLLFYYIITGALGFLFIQQALKLNWEQSRRKQEEQLVAKLQFKLSQNQQKIKPNKININSSGKIEMISTDKITYCKASGDYVEIYLNDKQQRLFSGNLKDIERLLPNTFSRVHRSYLVNIEFIVSLQSSSNGKQQYSSGSGVLLLDDGTEVPVSRRIMPKIRGVLIHTKNDPVLK